MEFRRLGDSGLAVSVAGLGTNNFGLRMDLAQCETVLNTALDLGITLIDTADAYGDSEDKLGELLVGRRDDVIIATKFAARPIAANGADWDARGSRRYIRKAVETSLRRLRTDWIDLYQYHRPDPHTPIEETLGALTELVREGKVRYLGHSNFTGWQTADAEWIARTKYTERFISAQNNYSLMDRSIEADLVPALSQYGIGMLPFYPLANGLLTGKYRRGEAAPAGSRIADPNRAGLLNDATFDKVEALEHIAQQAGVSLLQLAMGWLASRPTVGSVIAGATKPEQVTANAAALTWQPTPDVLAAVDALES